LLFFSLIESVSRLAILNGEFGLEGKSQAMWEIFRKTIEKTPSLKTNHGLSAVVF